MAMARDGLLPSFFSDVNRSTHVPIKSTIVTGLLATVLAFFMDVEQLSGLVCCCYFFPFLVYLIPIYNYIEDLRCNISRLYFFRRKRMLRLGTLCVQD